MKKSLYHNKKFLELGNEQILDQKYYGLSDYASFPKEIERFQTYKNFDAPLSADDNRTLIIPKNISLSGNFAGAEKAVIYGNFTCNDRVNNGNVVQVMSTGTLKGFGIFSVLIVSGVVEGEFNITEKLIIKNGGKLVGDVKYKDIIIEEGGKILASPKNLVCQNEFSTATPNTRSLRFGGTFSSRPTIRNFNSIKPSYRTSSRRSLPAFGSRLISR